MGKEVISVASPCVLRAVEVAPAGLFCSLAAKGQSLPLI